MPKQNWEHNDNADVWGYNSGEVTPTVTVWERQDKGGIVYVRWYVEEEKQGPFSLGYRIRDKGRIVKDKRQDAEDAAEAYYEAIHNGDPLPHEVIDDEPEDEEPDGPMTLRRGFDLVLDPEEGLYQASQAADDGDEHYRDRKRHANHLCVLLGGDRTWEEMIPSVVQSIWTKMATAHAENGRFGPRTAERTVGFLYRAQQWLVNNRKLDAREASSRMEGWRRQLKKDWERITEEDTDPYRPAHTEAEMELIMWAVSARNEDGNWVHPDLDPRSRMLLMSGAGQRTGMLCRAPRHWLHLDDSGAYGLGRLVIPTRGEKTGVTIDLTRALRDHIEREMASGYLRRLEPAYQRGDIDGYRLFPSGRLRGGAARADRGQSSVGKSWRGRMLRELEAWIFRQFPDLIIWNQTQRANRTMHIKNRGLHGLRRRVVRMSRKKGIDREDRNAAFGYAQGSTVADELYDETDEELRVAGAEARQEVLRALGYEEEANALSDVVEGHDADGGDAHPSIHKLREKLAAAVRAGEYERASEIQARIDDLEGGV